jgi:hypothetical protein
MAWLYIRIKIRSANCGRPSRKFPAATESASIVYFTGAETAARKCVAGTAYAEMELDRARFDPLAGEPMRLS